MAETARLSFQTVNGLASKEEFCITRREDRLAYVVEFADMPPVDVQGEPAARIYDCCEALLLAVAEEVRKANRDG